MDEEIGDSLSELILETNLKESHVPYKLEPVKVVTREAAKIIHEEEYTSNPESNHPDILCGLNGNGVADWPRLNKPNSTPPIMNINHKPSGVDSRNSLKSFINSLPINSPLLCFDHFEIPDQRRKWNFRLIFSQDLSSKKDLWENLLTTLDRKSGLWVMFDDFNSVRLSDDRKGSNFLQIDVDVFNEFIHRSVLVELQMGDGGSLESVEMEQN
ncbi:hypothetical protein Tco_1028248 [Tanacetum coccineum]|uniref:Uncharacterized protein n=1 Tax=Tanacetum coccineum TaxID=301880 RepID=A0ABQ5G292_9ASTR